MPHTVFVVDDDNVLLDEAIKALGERKFEVQGFSSGASVLDALQGPGALSPDIIVLDRMMPGWDGVTTLKKIRQADYTGPIIFLTALDEVEECIEGIEAGADDYLTKPFSYRELAVRIQARLRSTTSSEKTKILIGPFYLDLINNKVEINGVKATLRPKEFKLLRCLLENQGETLSRSEILKQAIGYNFDPGNNIVDVHISRLRKQMKSLKVDDWVIASDRGKGYTLKPVPKPESEQEESNEE